MTSSSSQTSTFLKSLTTGHDGMAIPWKRFSTEHVHIASFVNPSFGVVEAVINYAYTGRLTINAGAARRLYPLAHNLGSGYLVSWCVEFLRARHCKSAAKYFFTFKTRCMCVNELMNANVARVEGP